MQVAVNLSPAQFAGGGLVAMVAEALGTAGLAPERLELEITETAMLQETEMTLATLRGLQALGVGIAMDDFGTGYSSLGYLRRFPFDRLKIDRSFIEDLGQRDGERCDRPGDPGALRQPRHRGDGRGGRDLAAGRRAGAGAGRAGAACWCRAGCSAARPRRRRSPRPGSRPGQAAPALAVG